MLRIQATHNMRTQAVRAGMLALLILSGGVRTTFCQQENVTVPLRYQILSPAKPICAGSGLSVHAILTNVSHEDIAIDRWSLTYQVLFVPIENTPIATNRLQLEPPHVSSTGDTGMDYEGKFIVLKPGKSYRKKLRFSLSQDIFRRPGTFRLNVNYGQFSRDSYKGVRAYRDSVAANEVTFQIRSCEK